MKKFLAFHLSGMMSAWGDNLCGAHRPTSSRPGKSHITGLLGNAMGIDRFDPRLISLSRSFGFAVRVESKQSFLQDYQTFRVPDTRLKPVGQTYFDRRDELRDPGGLNTSLSWREYRVHASYSVIVWIKDGTSEFEIDALRGALARPKGLLFLGRKTCQLTSPIQPRIVEKENLFEAFKGYEPINSMPSFKLENPEYYFDHGDHGFKVASTIRRRDEMLSVKPRRFGLRLESRAA